ncbi:MAG: hypothetical protein AB7S71_04565 [Dongiaceae bacterium]
MNAAALKREIEMALGIAGAQAVDFWRIAAAAPAGTAAYDPQFSGGVFVATPGASAGQQAARHLAAGHKFTLDRHVDADLIRCVLAAADGDSAAARAQAIWAKLRPKIQQLSPAARNALARDLSSALQRGGRQP